MREARGGGSLTQRVEWRRGDDGWGVGKETASEAEFLDRSACFATSPWMESPVALKDIYHT